MKIISVSAGRKFTDLGLASEVRKAFDDTRTAYYSVGDRMSYILAAQTAYPNNGKLQKVYDTLYKVHEDLKRQWAVLEKLEEQVKQGQFF